MRERRVEFFTNWLRESGDLSKPALRASDAGGVDAIGGAQLGDRFGEVVADRTFGEVKLGGDLGAAAAVAGTLQNLTFAFRERIEFGVPGFGRERGIDHTKTAMNPAYGVGQLGCGTILQEIAACACIECAAKIAGSSESRENDRAHGGMAGAQVRCQLESSHHGHLDIGDENVRRQAGNGVERIATVGGAGHDGDVWLEFEQRGEGAQHHGLVLGQDDANGCAHTTTQCAFNWRDAVCGSSMRRVTPGSVVIERRPPSDCTRSRMPRRPLPSWTSWSFGWAPSSVMSSEWEPS